MLKYVTCRPPLHAGNRIEDPGGQGSAGDRLGSGASTFLVGDSGFSGACVTQLSATAATAMLRGGEWETESSYFGIRVRKKDRLAGREEETESNGRGKSLCASCVWKSIPESSEQRAIWLSGGVREAVKERLKEQREELEANNLAEKLVSLMLASLLWISNQLQDLGGGISKISTVISSCYLIKGSCAPSARFCTPPTSVVLVIFPERKIANHCT